MDLNLGIKTEERRPFQVVMARNAVNVTAEGRAAVEAIKAAGCDGWQCTSTSGRLVKRRNSAGVYLLGVQCDECGKFHSRGVKRTDHPGWASYMDFDPDQREKFQKKASQEWQEARAIALEDRRREYAEWLATSHEWAEIRARVMHRANRVCEACLSAPAQQVHHETYTAGKLPPAWLLRAVCRQCHEQIHGAHHDWARIRAAFA